MEGCKTPKPVWRGVTETPNAAQVNSATTEAFWEGVSMSIRSDMWISFHAGKQNAGISIDMSG